MSFNEFIKAAKKDPSLRSEIRVYGGGQFNRLKPEHPVEDKLEIISMKPHAKIQTVLPSTGHE